jgi:Chlorophyll A-B binding protein
LRPNDPETWEKVQTRELKNGRLAMLAIAAFLVQENLTGQGPIEQLVAGHISPFGT